MDDTEDQKKRENIPDPTKLGTQYRPMRNLVMVQMLPDVQQIGKIHLPTQNSIKADACEGHVLFKGPKCSEELEIGDCVTFEKQYAVGFELDGGGADFTLIPESAIVLRIPHETLRQSAQARTNATKKRA